MLSKITHNIIDIVIPSAGLGAIWGLRLAEWDHITKIACTILVTGVTLTLAILHHRRKK